jgi:hypothetical protein
MQCFCNDSVQYKEKNGNFHFVQLQGALEIYALTSTGTTKG